MKNYVNFKNFRKDVEKALTEVADRYGLTIHAGNISYDSNSFNMKLECERSDIDVAKARFMSDLTFMKRFGFSEDDYQKIVTIDKKQYVITGFKPGNKYNVLLKRCDTDREYAFVASAVAQCL